MSKWKHRLMSIDPDAATGDCAACGPSAPLSFHRTRGQWLCRAGRNARRTPRAPEQRRQYYLKQTFGLSVAEYDALLAAQGGVCAICGNGRDPDRRLAVDHDHATGTVRGLLCGRCNRALGLLGDDAAVVARAAQYLTR